MAFWAAEKSGKGEWWRLESGRSGGDASSCFTSSCFTSSVRYGSSFTSPSAEGLRDQPGESMSIGAQERNVDNDERSTQKAADKCEMLHVHAEIL